MSSKNFYGLTGDVTVDGGILNVGNAQLYANTETSNVGIGTPNPEFELDVRGDANVHNLYATYLHGDGSNIENIVSSQWEGSPGDPIYYASNVGIANTSPVTTTMQIGSNVVIDDVGSNVMHVTGNVHATRFIGDGAFLENIASNLHEITTNGNVTTNTVQFDGSTSLVTTGSVGIANTAPVHNLDIGSNLYVEDAGSNVLYVTGNIYADYLVGDGSQLTGIAASLDQIVDQGNTVSNTIQIVSGQDATSNIGLVTHDDVGISVSNTNPTGAFQFGVGSNLLVNVYSSNVLTVDGNVLAQKMTLGTVTVTPAYNLQQITTKGATTSQTLILENATTGLTTTSNVGIANTAPVHTLDVGSNLYVEDTGSNVLTVTGNVSVSGDLNVGSNLSVEDTGSNVLSVTGNVSVSNRLDVGSNLHIENLRVAEVASNLVTYDSTTGELMDSGGLFSNKLAVVSEQPPIALTGASTVVTNHGTYTIEASSGTVVNLFDKNDSTKWVTDGNYSTTVDTKGTYGGSASLAGHGGEWVKITMPYKTILRHIKIESTNQSVEDIELVGLNADGLTWTPLKTETGLTGPTHTIIVNATTHHRTYGLIVEKTNTTTGRSAVEIGDLKLFTESFSIDGGKVEMASSAVMGGDTIMDQHGPHGRADVPLRKYPEIVFDASKYDQNHSTSTYVQAGYTVTASSQANDVKNAATLYDGKFPDIDTSKTAWQGKINTYDSNGDATSIDTLTGITGGVGSRNGSYTTLELPHKIKVSRLQLHTRNLTNHSSPGHPGQVYVYGSNDGSSWTQIGSHLFTSTPSGPIWQTIDINSTTLYNYFALQATSILGTTGRLSLIDLEWYGYEEDPPAGDTSVDTTFTSIMNTPQTTGANVYVDGSLGETFTNRVTGPDATGPSATYDATGKYWELNGTLTSNIAVEANTFLEGDAPHSVSVWFNSSNLEANVSNTCVFSVSDQEHLNSENLDLQSNTWHNLTYAYQGEGGSRVTYLDGRKVAEDQAEDTFGEYPPFAMTGYSQGGYVASASSENSDGTRPAWKAFNNTTSGTFEAWGTEGGFTSGVYSSGGNSFTLNGSSESGHWLKLELPHKIYPSYATILTHASNTGFRPTSGFLIGSNDDENWDVINQYSALSYTSGIATLTSQNINKAYKYILLLIQTLDTNTGTYTFIENFDIYGHRENDLVRLPDPTNVLKYPHIAMTGPAQRGYVASASSTAIYNASLAPKNAFNGIISPSSATASWQSLEDGYNTTSPYNYKASSPHTSSLSTSTTQYNGEWLSLETPHKIKIQSYKLYINSDVSSYRADSIVLLGSDTTTNGSWNLLHAETSATYTNDVYTATVNSNTSYKYHRLLFESLSGSGGEVYINELEYYGTGVDSIPIQIGGGNIDKVANFRVYDKFVGEDQALEIWDAQKDAFGRAKSSMTLQKGRLGIGTTEPEGRLAVADEPDADAYGLQEFPPKPLAANNTHIEGHGVFRASASSVHNSSYLVQSFRAFDHNIGSYHEPYYSDNPYGDQTGDGSYVGGDYTTNGYAGEWLQLQLPYKVKLSKFSLTPRIDWGGRAPKQGVILALNYTGNEWVVVHTHDDTGGVYGNGSGFNAGGVETRTFKVNGSNDGYYDTFRFVTTHIWTPTGSSGTPNIAEWRLFGTREQGQSVLHDGQLTLTKSLNVPRIGPALDADDTPRRDRLVVEYNTSTNPTFEGAVRDTSGRGNDGVFYGGASYDATEKALVFDGDSDYIMGHLGNAGDTDFTVSLWLKKNTSGTVGLIWNFGGSGGTGNPEDSVALEVGSSNNLDYFIFSGAEGAISNFGTTYLGKWVHVVATRSGNNLKIYLDGVDQNMSITGTDTLQLARNSEFTIGARGTGALGNNSLNGSISNFKIYDTVLTAEEVKTLYDMGRCDEGHHTVNFSKTRVGIGLGDGEAPHDELDVRGNVRGSDNVIVGPYGGQWWRLYTFQNNGNLGFIGENGTEHGYLVDSGTVNIIDFTGQHRAVIDKVNVSDYENFEGLIVSANKNKYINVDNDITTGSNAIQISQSLPLVSLSNVVHDKACYGVIAGSEDVESRTYEQGTFVSVFQKQKGDTRAYINSVGEGAIWVVNTNGSLESGDYITTSNVAGYGQKQDDDVLHNYTVAKITMDCDFEPATQPVQQILRSNVVETYYLGNVHHTKTVPHEFVTTTVTADDAWSNVSISPSDTTYAEWSNLEANTQNTYTLTYTQTSNVVYDTKYTLTTTANVTESDAWDRVFVDPPTVTYAEYSNLEANTQNTYTLTYTQTTTDEKTPDEWSNLESNVQSLYNKVYYQSVEEEVAKDYPGAVAHTRVTDVIENELDEHGQIQWEDHPTDTEKAYKIRYLDASGVQTDSANAVHIAAFVGCTYHCG
jgi:hypothetical protein